MHLTVRVQPRSSRNEVVRLPDGRWKIRLTAPPVGNAANEALIRFLSGLLDLPKAGLSILRGEKSRTKSLSVSGRTNAGIEERLARAATSPTIEGEPQRQERQRGSPSGRL